MTDLAFDEGEWRRELVLFEADQIEDAWRAAIRHQIWQLEEHRELIMDAIDKGKSALEPLLGQLDVQLDQLRQLL